MGEFEHIQKRHVSKRGRISELILFCIESFRLGSSRNEKLQSGYMFLNYLLWVMVLRLVFFGFGSLVCFVFVFEYYFVLCF